MHARTWRPREFTLNFILLNEEPDGVSLSQIYDWAKRSDLENPRVISPRTLSWSSVFQPHLFQAINRSVRGSALSPVRFVPKESADYPTAYQDMLFFWLQSVVFLSAVTLSTAIIQGRWSLGTIGSKLDRLWQAGALRCSIPALVGLQIHNRIESLVADLTMNNIDKLLEIRRMFKAVIAALTAGAKVRSELMVASLPDNRQRFGFVDALRADVRGLHAIIVYGSSVSSSAYADFDIVLVVDDAEATLRRMENSCPRWEGKELNIGVYTRDELWNMQVLSGDNLAEYGLCLHGEVELPAKPIGALLARNFSFGIVRQRQQLGMIGIARDFADDKKNLFEYFVKIPSNIVKGTFGATGSRRTKEDVNRWLLEKCGFDTLLQQALAVSGDAVGPLAKSAVATGEALNCLNDELHVVELYRNEGPTAQ